MKDLRELTDEEIEEVNVRGVLALPELGGVVVLVGYLVVTIDAYRQRVAKATAAIGAYDGCNCSGRCGCYDRYVKDCIEELKAKAPGVPRGTQEDGD